MIKRKKCTLLAFSATILLSACNVEQSFDKINADNSSEESGAETDNNSETGSSYETDNNTSETSSWLDDKEYALTNTPLMAEVKRSIATLDNADVENVQPGREANPDNVRRVESIISQEDFNYLFPKRTAEYTYEKFLKASAKFPAFCGHYEDGRDSEAICAKSLATMFAHFAQETGGHTSHWDVAEWRQGLVHVREMAWDETMRGGYNGECNPTIWQGQTWPCGTFDNGDYKSYFGRGAKQLSYNYNYGPFSEAMYGDVRVLLDHPERVADTWLNLASAVFFFVYPQPPKPSMLHVIDGTWQPNESDIAAGLTPGFGVTTSIINGGVECGGSVEIAQSKNRISYYRGFANYLNVVIPDDEVLGCAGMQQFSATGNGALNIYWEQDWSYLAEMPEGKSFACKLVGYQTPFSAFKEGDYTACVNHHFDLSLLEGTEWELNQTDTDNDNDESNTNNENSSSNNEPAASGTPEEQTNEDIVNKEDLGSPSNTPDIDEGNDTFTPYSNKAWSTLSNKNWLTRKSEGLRENNVSYQNTSGKMVAAYFVEWGIYGRAFYPKDIPVENLTHIFYGFIPVCGPNDSLTGSAKTALDTQCQTRQNYEVVVHDKFAALEKNDFDASGKWDDDVKGIFAEMYRMKMTYPHIKIIPSIGGWTLSDPLYTVGVNAQARSTFIASAIAMLKQYEFFDGLDIDWEFPGGGGANAALGSNQDGEGFATLMVELRTALDALSAQNGRHYELTAAVSGGVEKLSKVDWENAAPAMDLINLMTYDYYGAWSTTYGHQTGLYDTNSPSTPYAGYTVDDAVSYMTEQRSVPASKIGIGVAMYGRGWQGINGGNETGPFNGIASGGSAIQGSQQQGFWENGIMDYKGAETYMMGSAEGSGINGFTLFWDAAAKASYLWNAAEGKLVTLDTPRSVIEKGKYVKDKGLAGLFAWEIDADNGNILNAMHKGLGHSQK